MHRMNALPTLSLAGRVSVVTGAARGIQFACATALAAAGSHVAVCDLDAATAASSAAKLAAVYGVHGHGYAINVTKPDEVRAGVARIAADFGAIDHVVNNAGVQYIAPIAEFGDADWDRVRSASISTPSSI